MEQRPRATMSTSTWVEGDLDEVMEESFFFFCRGRLCRLIAVGHSVRHTKRTNYQQVKR